MTDQDRTEQRDEVLFAFHQECNDPTAEQIIQWAKRFPQFADDIRGHATILKDWADREGLAAKELSETMLSRSRSRALNALYNAEAALAKQPVGPERSFEQLMNASGTDIPQLARDLDIARTVLAALVAGRMRDPVGKRLVAALMVRLAIAPGEFDAALRLAFAAPRIGHAKADGTPTVILRSYDDLIRDSSMTDERKQYWLSED
jgi:hypothetical protein